MLLKTKEPTSMGRLLLELEYNGQNINQIMLEKWGVSYFGGHKNRLIGICGMKMVKNNIS